MITAAPKLQPPKAWPWLVALLAVAAVNFLMVFPRLLSFVLYAFHDQGSVFRADAMLAAGLRPTIDFNYFYGALSLFLGSVWFEIGGRTPQAYIALMIVANLVGVWGVWRFVTAAGWGWLPRLFLLTVLPAMVLPAQHSLVHALEPVLLIHALAFHAQGRRDRALLFTVVAVFIKPGFGYAYGAVLLGLEALDWLRRRKTVAAVVRDLLPASVVGIVLVVALGMAYGLRPLFDMQIPLRASHLYASIGLGFFGVEGRNLWHLAGKAPRDYLAFPTGVWLASSALTVIAAAAAGLAALTARDQGAAPPPVDPSGRPRNRLEMVLTLGLLQVVWILGFFSNTVSWAYYSFISFFGAGYALDLSRRSLPAPATWGLAAGMTLLGLLSNYNAAVFAPQIWRGWEPAPGDHGLVLEHAMKEEWETCHRLAGEPFAVLTNGYCDHYDDQTVMADVWFMSLVDHLTPRERASLLQATADRPILFGVGWPEFLGDPDWLLKRPLIQQILSGRKELFRGRYFILYSKPARRAERGRESLPALASPSTARSEGLPR